MKNSDKWMLIGMYIAATADVLIAVAVWLILIAI
jgi:hypothetical protein